MGLRVALSHHTRRLTLVLTSVHVYLRYGTRVPSTLNRCHVRNVARTEIQLLLRQSHWSDAMSGCEEIRKVRVAFRGRSLPESHGCGLIGSGEETWLWMVLVR